MKNTNHYVGNPAREVDIETANGIIVEVKKLSSAQKFHRNLGSVISFQHKEELGVPIY